MIRLEICANGLQSVLNAQDGLAQCVELCESLEVGGLTPSFGTLAAVAERMFIPVRVLIRPRPGNYIYDEQETDIMINDIMLCNKLGYEGVVIGALTPEGMPDYERLARLMQAGEGMKFTFHRAIDACADPLKAIERLIEMGFDKILTSGGKPYAIEGMELIKAMQDRYGDKINIMAGGGINLNNVIELLNTTGIKNCHASLSCDVEHYGKDLYPEKVDATGASMCWKVSNLEMIKEMSAIIGNDY